MNASDIVDDLPEGYRWATAEETEEWDKHHDRMVQVRTGGTDKDPQTDLAIQILVPFSALDLDQLRDAIHAIGVEHLPDAGDYQAFSESAIDDLNGLLATIGLWGCHIGWESDGTYACGILVELPNGDAWPVPDPFQTNEEPWSVTPEAVEAMLHDLLNLRAKYGPALEAARAAFLTVMEAP